MAVSRDLSHPEAGGVTIVVAMTLLATATLVAVTLGRTSLREALITGNESTSRKAYEIADSGMDYVITWAGNPSAAGSTNTTAQAINTLYNNTVNLIDPVNNVFTLGPGGTIGSTLLAADQGGDMTPGTTGYLQSTQVVPAFDVEIRSLGRVHPNDPKDLTWYFMIRTTGRANIGSTGQSFISIRETLNKK